MEKDERAGVPLYLCYRCSLCMEEISMKRKQALVMLALVLVSWLIVFAIIWFIDFLFQ